MERPGISQAISRRRRQRRLFIAAAVFVGVGLVLAISPLLMLRASRKPDGSLGYWQYLPTASGDGDAAARVAGLILQDPNHVEELLHRIPSADKETLWGVSAVLYRLLTTSPDVEICAVAIAALERTAVVFDPTELSPAGNIATPIINPLLNPGTSSELARCARIDSNAIAALERVAAHRTACYLLFTWASRPAVDPHGTEIEAGMRRIRDTAASAIVTTDPLPPGWVEAAPHLVELGLLDPERAIAWAERVNGPYRADIETLRPAMRELVEQHNALIDAIRAAGSLDPEH